MSLAWKMMESPVGKLKLIASDKGLAAILWKDDRPSRVRLSDLVENNQHPVLVETERQLREYFAGGRKEFSIALDMPALSFRKMYGRHCSSYPSVKREATDSSQNNSETLRRQEQSEQQTEETRYPSSCLAIASSDRLESSQASRAASKRRRICSIWRRRIESYSARRFRNDISPKCL